MNFWQRRRKIISSLNTFIEHLVWAKHKTLLWSHIGDNCESHQFTRIHKGEFTKVERIHKREFTRIHTFLGDSQEFTKNAFATKNSRFFSDSQEFTFFFRFTCSRLAELRRSVVGILIFHFGANSFMHSKQGISQNLRIPTSLKEFKSACKKA